MELGNILKKRPILKRIRGQEETPTEDWENEEAEYPNIVDLNYKVRDNKVILGDSKGEHYFLGDVYALDTLEGYSPEMSVFADDFKVMITFANPQSITRYDPDLGIVFIGE